MTLIFFHSTQLICNSILNLWICFTRCLPFVDYIYEMVFRIRDKSLFWTKSGWKNTWEPKILNMPKPINSVNTQYVTCRFDHHSFLRSKRRFIQSFKLIATSPEPASNTFMEIRMLRNFWFLSWETNSGYHSTVKLQLSSLKTEL